MFLHMKQELIASHIPVIFTENREILQFYLDTFANFIIKEMNMETRIYQSPASVQQVKLL